MTPVLLRSLIKFRIMRKLWTFNPRRAHLRIVSWAFGLVLLLWLVFSSYIWKKRLLCLFGVPKVRRVPEVPMLFFLVRSLALYKA
jgi:hypothetical protein